MSSIELGGISGVKVSSIELGQYTDSQYDTYPYTICIMVQENNTSRGRR